MAGPRAIFLNAKRFWRGLAADDVGDFAAGLSYRFFLALFPFFIFITAVGGFVAKLAGVENPSTEVLNRFGDALPSDARSVLETQLGSVLGEQRPGLLSVGLLGTMWAASGGVGALMKAMNRMYGVEETRPFWRRTAIALGLTLLGGGLFIAAFILAVAGRAIATAVVDALSLGDFATAAITASGYLLAVVLLLVSMAFLYWAAPNARLPFRWVSPGAILFAAGWFVATLLFGLYVSSFASYNATYGALGGVAVLMVWFYLTAYILLAGAELNAIVARRASPVGGEAPAEPGRQQGADAGDYRGTALRPTPPDDNGPRPEGSSRAGAVGQAAGPVRVELVSGRVGAPTEASAGVSRRGDDRRAVRNGSGY